VLIYPTLGHLLGLSQHAFGLWSGTAINDNVFGGRRSTTYGHAAVSYAVVVNSPGLGHRPISLFLAVWRSRSVRGTVPLLARGLRAMGAGRPARHTGA